MGYLEVFLTLVVVGLIVGTILALTNVINIPGITPNNTADLEYNKLQNLLNKNNTESEPEEPEPEEPEPEEPIVPTSNVPPPPVPPTVAPAPALTYNTHGNNGGVPGNQFCGGAWGGGKMCKYGINNATGTPIACDAVLTAGNYSFQCDGPATYNTPGNNGSVDGNQYCGGVWGGGKMCKYGKNADTGTLVTCNQGLAAGNYSFQCEGVYTNNALHWPRIENEICSIGTDCLGYVAGQPTLACDRGKCVYQKKDWSGFYYAPSECKGSGHSQAGTC